MRKHQFKEPTYPLKLNAPWKGRKCIYCGDISGLDDWQIERLPKAMAECVYSDKRAGILEVLLNNINCLDPHAKGGG